MPCARLRSLLSAIAPIIAAQLMLLGAAAAEADAPVDVPDEFGLGERLALVAWLNDHHVAVADPNDLTAMRRLYTAHAHPDRTAQAQQADQEKLRSDLAAELYRKFGRNPPPGASIEDITALITTLTEHENEVVASDQAIARANAQAHPRQSAPAAPAVPPAGPTPASPRAPLDPPPGAPAPQDNPRLAAGIAVGRPFPALSGRCIDGTPVSSADWKGKIVLIDAWATWCGPCMREMPNVIAAYNAFHPLGLEILGISMDTEMAKLRAGLSTHHIEWPQIMEPFAAKGPWVSALAITYIPSNFLLDATGTIIAIDLRGAALRAALVKAFGQSP